MFLFFKNSFQFLQFPLEEFRQLGVEVHACISAEDAVVAVGIYLHVELLAQLH